MRRLLIYLLLITQLITLGFASDSFWEMSTVLECVRWKSVEGKLHRIAQRNSCKVKIDIYKNGFFKTISLVYYGTIDNLHNVKKDILVFTSNQYKLDFNITTNTEYITYQSTSTLKMKGI